MVFERVLHGEFSAEAAVTLFAAIGVSIGTGTVPVDALAELRGCTTRTIRRHLDELDQAGALDANGVPLPIATMRERAVTSTSLPVTRMTRRMDALVSAVHAASRESQEAGAAKDARRAAKPARQKPATPKSQIPPLLAHMSERVIKMEQAVFRPAYGVREMTQMGKLLDAMRGDVEGLVTIIDWLTVDANWRRARERFQVDSTVPTPGILLGFGTSMVPWVLERMHGKRSGNATSAPLTTKDDAHEF